MITPGSVDKEQFPQIPELAYRHIGRPCGLETLDTAYTDTNVGRLDHANIIGTVADGKKKRLEVSLDQLDNQSFLKGRHPAVQLAKFSTV